MVASPPETDQRLRVGNSARILYVNGDGRTSERTIDIIRCFTSRYGVTYLRAWCHLRDEERTFRTDRVLAVLESHPSAAQRSRPQPATARRPAAWSMAAPEAPSQPTPSPRFDVAPRPAASPSTRSTPTQRPRRYIFAKLVGATAALLVTAWLWNQAEDSGARFTPAPPPVAIARVEPARAVAPSPPPDEIHLLEYRGQRIEERRIAGHNTYTLIVSGRTHESIHDARIAINTSLLSARAGITDPDVADLFAGADGNRDGEVSWEEIQRFQTALDRNYRYELNPTALRPDEFLAAGGGDCEDWALMTAGLLRFWGIPVFIGSLSSSTGNHAVALVPATSIPPGAMTIEVPAGGGLRSGSYVPIDYAHVGRLSNAVARRFTVERVWVPEEIYGWSM